MSKKSYIEIFEDAVVSMGDKKPDIDSFPGLVLKINWKKRKVSIIGAMGEELDDVLDDFDVNEGMHEDLDADLIDAFQNPYGWEVKAPKDPVPLNLWDQQEQDKMKNVLKFYQASGNSSLQKLLARSLSGDKSTVIHKINPGFDMCSVLAVAELKKTDSRILNLADRFAKFIPALKAEGVLDTDLYFTQLSNLTINPEDYDGLWSFNIIQFIQSSCKPDRGSLGFIPETITDPVTGYVFEVRKAIERDLEAEANAPERANSAVVNPSATVESVELNVTKPEWVERTPEKNV